MVVGVDKVTPVLRNGGRLSYIRIGAVGVSTKLLKTIFALVNTKIVFDLLYGRDVHGFHGIFARFACSAGHEVGIRLAFDVFEDIVSTFYPPANLVPTPVAYRDYIVPAEVGHFFATANGWKFLYDRACTQHSATSCQPVISGFLEGYGIFRLAKWR